MNLLPELEPYLEYDWTVTVGEYEIDRTWESYYHQTWTRWDAGSFDFTVTKTLEKDWVQHGF